MSVHNTVIQVGRLGEIAIKNIEKLYRHPYDKPTREEADKEIERLLESLGLSDVVEAWRKKR